MHITLGAAVLAVGLLYLLAIPAGRKVLGVVFGLAIIGVIGLVALVAPPNGQAQHEAYVQQKAANAQFLARVAACEKRFPHNELGPFRGYDDPATIDARGACQQGRD
jgi:hypothetical protein